MKDIPQAPITRKEKNNIDTSNSILTCLFTPYLESKLEILQLNSFKFKFINNFRYEPTCKFYIYIHYVPGRVTLYYQPVILTVIQDFFPPP